MDYNLPDCMSFSTGMGNGDTLEFVITVNSDNLTEWEECIIIVTQEPTKDNVVIDGDNSQYKIIVYDSDSKNCKTVHECISNLHGM